MLPPLAFTPVTTVGDTPADVCAELGPSLGLAASYHASGQDAAATGSDHGSFLDEPPPLLTDTDIAMTVCGALLGVVAVLSYVEGWGGGGETCAGARTGGG